MQRTAHGEHGAPPLIHVFDGPTGASPMSPSAAERLEALRADYAQVAGKPFSHFYCPLLFRDEHVPLCEAHIVNKALHQTGRGGVASFLRRRPVVEARPAGEGRC